MLLLLEFNFDSQHQPGTQHAVEEYLRWIENRADAMEGDNDFPDGAFLHIEANDPNHHLAPPRTT